MKKKTVGLWCYKEGEIALACEWYSSFIQDTQGREIDLTKEFKDKHGMQDQVVLVKEQMTPCVHSHGIREQSRENA